MIAATNRQDLIDDALTRAGRIERKIEVGEPDEETRHEILAIHTRTRPLVDDVDLDHLAAETDGFVGTDLAAVCREAATVAVREHVPAQTEGVTAAVQDIVLTQAHFEAALEEIISVRKAPTSVTEQRSCDRGGRPPFSIGPAKLMDGPCDPMN